MRLLKVKQLERYAFKRFEKSIKIGVATQSDEYVPITTPTSKANKNPLMAGPPKINMIKTTTNKIIEVLKVLLKVVFNDLLTAVYEYFWIIL